MIKTLMSILLLCAVIFSGCATILSPGSQEIAFKSDKQIIKVSVDSSYAGEGKDVKFRVEKDFRAKQVTIESEGYKKENFAFVQDSRSPFYIMSWIPFGILLYPPFYDLGPSGWNYDDAYTFNNMIKYPVWNNSQKRVFFGNIAFDIKKANHTLNSYSYSDFIDKDTPSRITNLDSVNFKSTIFEDEIEKVLERTQYIDTSNTVFFDNLNSLVLRCKVTKISVNDVRRTYVGMIGSSFLQSAISTDWVIEDLYGDTLFVESANSESGYFAYDLFKGNADKEITKSIGDAIEVSLLNLMNSPKISGILKFDSVTTVKFDKLAIKSPGKLPSDIEQAMAATVTVKSLNSHGSGFLISNDGYIITNHHVVNAKKKYTVLTNDGKEIEATVVRTNKVLDLALLKIDGDFEYAFKIPESKNYKIGQSIFAIGTPKSLDLGQSVSKGVVSSLRKYRNYNYIQSDVSINKGNSGGPIVSENGELLSIVEWKMFGIGTEGISFSIPAEDVMEALSISY